MSHGNGESTVDFIVNLKSLKAQASTHGYVHQPFSLSEFNTVNNLQCKHC